MILICLFFFVSVSVEKCLVIVVVSQHKYYRYVDAYLGLR